MRKSTTVRVDRVGRPRRPALAAAGAVALSLCAMHCGGASDAAPADTYLADSAPADVLDTTPEDAADTAGDAPDAPLDGLDTSEPDADTAAADSSGAGDTVAPNDTAPNPCEPPVAFTDDAAWTVPYGQLDLAVAGGSGDTRFALVDNASGGILDPRLGIYLAGPERGVTDRARVTDQTCGAMAEIAIHVVSPMDVQPRAVELVPSGGFTFWVEGGSGDRRFELVNTLSGATLDDNGTYSAGPREGRDELLVRDTRTDEAVTVTVRVKRGARIAPRDPVVYAPVGHRYPIEVDGGSGVFDVSGPALAPSDNAMIPVVAGLNDVSIVDHFTGAAATLTLVGVAAVDHDVVRSGYALYQNDIITPGDIDGDGFADAVVTNAETNLNAFQAGAVYVFAGSSTGLRPTPAQVLAGAKRVDRFGRTAAVADLDDDGHLDLVVGASAAETAPLGTNGVISLFRGVARGFFEPEPYQVIGGRASGDQAGYALATCDLNADGHLDLIYGAPYAEDRSLTPLAPSQGEVGVFLGRSTGLFRPDPDQVVFGTAPNAVGDWGAAGGMLLGWSLAAGDFDGDGACDVAAGGYNHRPPGGAVDGAVLVFRGIRDDNASSELPLVASPVGAWRGEGDGRMGQFLSAGDVNADGLADLAVSHGYSNTGGPRRGTADVILGGSWAATPALAMSDRATMSWSAAGAGNYDYYGYRVALGDMTGDGIDDVLVTGWLDECDGCPNNAGVVNVYAGVEGLIPELYPSRSFSGIGVGDRFGTALGALDDLDGDGLPEGIFMAGNGDEHGPDVGSLYTTGYPDPEQNVPIVPLEMPGEPGGWRVGQGVANLGDRNGDGYDELAVGAVEATAFRDAGAPLLRAGTVSIYRGTATGIEATPRQVIPAPFAANAFDQFGNDVADIGDFDGDGRPDLAVAVRVDDRPATFPSEVVSTGDCPSGAATNLGAVYVFAGLEGGDIAETPSFIRMGAQASQGVEIVQGVGDVDGDGLQDVAWGSLNLDRPGADNVGGFEVVLGRPAAADGKITRICDRAFFWRPAKANDQAGTAIAPLGDLDADGCDELAVGVWLDDDAASSAGAVIVLAGWGPRCARAEPMGVKLLGLASNDRLGYALDGGHDLDGDGLNELVIGGHEHVEEGEPRGAVWLVDGRRLAARLAEAVPFTDGDGPAAAFPVVPPEEAATWRVSGARFDEELGIAVAAVDRLGAGGGPGIAAVGLKTPLFGEEIGGARVFRVLIGDDGALLGIAPEPVALFAGEAHNPLAMVGARVTATTRADRTLVVLGVPYSGWHALDSGAAYVLDLRHAEGPR